MTFPLSLICRVDGIQCHLVWRGSSANELLFGHCRLPGRPLLNQLTWYILFSRRHQLCQHQSYSLIENVTQVNITCYGEFLHCDLLLCMPFWIMDSVRDKPDEEAFLPKANKYEDAERPDIGLQKNARWKSFLRMGIEVMMGVVIIFLFLRPLPDNTTSKPSPVPKRKFRSRI